MRTCPAARLNAGERSSLPTPADSASFGNPRTGLGGVNLFSTPPYQWYYTDDLWEEPWTTILGAVSTTLTFTAEAGQHGLRYGCRVANDCG